MSTGARMAVDPLNLSMEYKYLYISPQATDDSCSSFFDALHVCFSNSQVHSQATLIEGNNLIQASETQDPAAWHLNHISTANRHRGHLTYVYSTPQSKTRIYIMDTWIDPNHPEYKERFLGSVAFAKGETHPHGTHVAALAAGKTVGVNRAATITSVQVLDDSSFGSWATFIRGLEWIAHQPKGIINISISGKRSEIVDQVINTMIAKGWNIVVASGNASDDGCLYSPGSSKALSVGATDFNGHFATFSNYGECLDMNAPGSDILSAYPSRRYAYMSGTSMASPIVAGIWSLYPNLDKDSFLKKVGRKGLVFYRKGKTPNLFPSIN